MEIKVEAQGIEAAKEDLARLRRELKAAMKHAVVRAMDTVEIGIKNKLRQKTHPRKTKTPSMPGEPPALITGNMMRSVRGSGPKWTDEVTVTGRVAPHVVQSRIQELGGYVRVRNRGQIGPQTVTGYAYLPPRPYVAPVVAEKRAQIERIFAEEIGAAIRAVCGGR